MDNKFDRIVREPFVMGGQARIRDTNITVNEIVRLSLDGTSQTDILAKYPQLEAEDVHQALGWAINDLKEATGYWRNETLTPLVSASGYSEPSNYALAKAIKGEDSIVEIIHRNAVQAIARLQHFGSYHQIQYPDHARDAEPISIQKVIEDSPKYAQEINPNIQILVSFADTSLKMFIPDYGYLSQAIAFLLASEAWFFQETSELTVAIEKNVLQIEVQRKLQNEHNNDKTVKKLTDVHTSSMVSVANLIIYYHHCELKVHQLDDTVIFGFELPIWKDEQD